MLEVHDLTVPETTSTVRRVLSGALRRLARDLARLRHPVLDPVRAVFTAELAREPGRAFAVLRRPNVGAFVRTMRDHPERIEELAPALAATIALELDHAGTSLPPLDFARTPERIVCLGGRFAVAGGVREHPFHDVDRAIVLATVDDNPLAMVEAHPDKEGNAIDLGGQPIEAWTSMLKQALAIIGEHLPVLREEMDLVLQQFIPVGYDEVKHLSASYQESIGTVYLTLHPSVMTMTEAVIHEFSHNKLNALFELDGVLENAFSPLFTSPVRPDPRPLHGVLLAVHAFLPVAELYRRMIAAGDPRARPDRFEQIVGKNHEGASVLLENARPTATGRGLLEEIRRLDERFT